MRTNLLATLLLLLAAGQNAMATTKTVTYKITDVESINLNYTIVFTRSGDDPFDTSAPTTYTATIPAGYLAQTTGGAGGFSVELADGFKLSLSWGSGSDVRITNNCFRPWANNKYITYAVSCPNTYYYYTTHVMLTGMESGFQLGMLQSYPHYNEHVDYDFDNVWGFSQSYQSAASFGQITISYSDSPSLSIFEPAGAYTYNIKSTTDLRHLANYVNNGGNDCQGLTFLQTQDITYTNNTTEWNNASSQENNYTAIGTIDHRFKGTFDGQNHTIRGIRLYQGGYNAVDKYQGLFGCIGSGGTVRCVNLADARITGFAYVGGIAGCILGATVEDCSVDAEVCIHAVQGDSYYHGGIVGDGGGTVQRCISRASLTATTTSGCQYFGAIIGVNPSNYSVTDCIAIDATVPGITYAGVIAGQAFGATKNNYYRACTVGGTANATGVGVGPATINDSPHDITNKRGAMPLYSLTLPGNVTLERTASAILPGTGNATYNTGADIEGIPYAYEGATLTLSYSGSIPDGGSVIYKVNGTAVDGNTFTMPAQEVTITTQLVSTVSYIDADGNAASQAGCIPIVSSDINQEYGTEGQTNWYYVSGDMSTNQLKFRDATTNIILCDGATLNISVTSSYYGIYNNKGAISIFAQSGGSGTLLFSGGISGIQAYTDITINGATITVSNANNYGIAASNGDVTIRGGNVNASGKYAGIRALKNVNITGGIISASRTYLSNNDGGISAANGAITLGCSNASDRITASSYYFHSMLKVADGQTLTDGTATYTGTLSDEQMAAIAGKTLRLDIPASVELTLVQGTKDGITAYWGTYYGIQRYTLPEGAAAYTMDNSKNLYRLGADGRTIPANTAVVIIADKADITLTKDDDDTTITDHAPGGNQLQGTVSAVSVSDLPAGKSAYVLSVDSSGAIGFRQYTATQIPANKAYYLQ